MNRFARLRWPAGLAFLAAGLLATAPADVAAQPHLHPMHPANQTARAQQHQAMMQHLMMLRHHVARMHHAYHQAALHHAVRHASLDQARRHVAALHVRHQLAQHYARQQAADGPKTSPATKSSRPQGTQTASLTPQSRQQPFSGQLQTQNQRRHPGSQSSGHLKPSTWQNGTGQSRQTNAGTRNGSGATPPTATGKAPANQGQAPAPPAATPTLPTQLHLPAATAAKSNSPAHTPAAPAGRSSGATAPAAHTLPAQLQLPAAGGTKASPPPAPVAPAAPVMTAKQPTAPATHPTTAPHNTNPLDPLQAAALIALATSGQHPAAPKQPTLSFNQPVPLSPIRRQPTTSDPLMQQINALGGGQSNYLNDLLGPQLANAVRPMAAPLSAGVNPFSPNGGQGQAIYNAMTRYYGSLPAGSLGYNPGALSNAAIQNQRSSNYAGNIFDSLSRSQTGIYSTGDPSSWNYLGG